MNDPCVCTVDVSPDEVDAGADVTLRVRVSGLPDDVATPSVSIRDRDGTELVTAALAGSEAGEALESDDIVLPAPRTAGDHVWRAFVVTAQKDGVVRERGSTEILLVVKPHAAMLNVWDIPTAIVVGERFKFTVGVRCSAGCCLDGQALSIVGRDGVQIGVAKLSRDIWPGTDALHFAEVEAAAPPAVGHHQWQVKTDAWDCKLPHEPGSSAMFLRVVRPPDGAVTVEAFDRETQTPIEGATVVMHPYRALTGGNGAARVEVTRGRYDVLISAAGYVPAAITLDFVTDMTTRAELDLELTLGSEEEGY